MSESAIFKVAVKLPHDQRAGYLDRACGTKAELRHDVESLLRANDASGGILRDREATVAHQPVTEGPGTIIGPYKLMEAIGEGGMGLVFVAEQQYPLRRKVAIKIIKPGMDRREVIARFEAERQALALMEHVNIAKVLDAGATDSGRPYFVMELVKGIPIIDYCDQQQLTADERLKLFVSVCLAVQHAHSKGIIHRDLKPSNILVAPHDGVPVVKVIDFGVAKAIGQQLTEKTIYTRFTQMIGTPLYMSPEQAEFNALDVDIRSDIYSLGVLLYELLTGTTPFDRERFATAAFEEIRRIIKEEEPPTPSTRLSTMGASLSKVSTQRKTEPGKLSALVKGDLDWIVMKALEKERSRRYDTAIALASDVRRFLAEEPVEARPPSALYRFRKLARRNKVAITTAGLVAAAILVGSAASLWQAVRATRAERAAVLSAEVAKLNEVAAQGQKQEADVAKERALKRSDELAILNEKLRRANYIADVNLARHAWEENNVGLTEDLLERHRPKLGETDLRGFEWGYLHRLPHSDVHTVQAHVGVATTVGWTPEGKGLLSVGTIQRESALDAPREVKLWDAARLNALPLQLKGETDKIVRGTLSPDGKSFAAGCHDNVVRIWNIATGSLSATLEGHTALVWHVTFSSDGKRLASRSLPWKSTADTSEIKVWDLETGKAIVSIDGLRPSSSRALDFSSDGKRLAAGFDTNMLKIWDAASGEEVLVKGLERSSISCLVFSPDGQRMAVSGMTRDVELLDAATGDVVRTFPGEFVFRSRLTFSPNGDRLASATPSGIELWDVDSGRLVRTFKGHVGPVLDVAFSPDGTHLASAGADGRIKVWDANGDRAFVSVSGPMARVFMMISPGGKFGLTGLRERSIQLWNTGTGEPLGEPLNLEHPVENWAFTADDSRLALTDADNNASIWDPATGKVLHTFKHDGPARSIQIALSPDGKWLACPGPEMGLKVWDVAKGVELRAFKDLPGLRAFSFSPDSKRLAVGEQSGVLKIWDVATGREICTTEFKNAHIMSLCFSPDGKRLAAQCVAYEQCIRIVDSESGQEVAQAIRMPASRCLQFSPDGKRLATGLTDGALKLWDVLSGQETLTLKGHNGPVSGLAFSPDGNRLFSTGDLTIRVWDATPLPDETR